MFAKRLIPLLLLLALAGCERIGNLLDLPDPKKDAAIAEAEGKAVGGACRQGGRSLEDCYTLNPKPPRAAIFAGWRDMNDYMMQNDMQSAPSQLAQPLDPVVRGREAKEDDKTAAPASTGETLRRSRRSRTTS